jgi:DNA-binding Xre family transcriptional regulator
MNLSRVLAENLRKRRGEMTQRDFAKKAGISKTSLDRIEKGEQNVTLSTLQQLMKSLKCKPSDLLE